MQSTLPSPVRRTSATSRIVVPAFLVILASACGDEGGEDQTPVASCDTETRAEPYVANLEKTGASGMKIVLVSSTPTPPSKGNNDWTIRVLDSSGNPLDGLTIDVLPFMPDHGHDSVIFPTIRPVTDSPGEYLLQPVRLWMPGYWEVTVSVDDQAGSTDSVKFKLCIEG